MVSAARGLFDDLCSYLLAPLKNKAIAFVIAVSNMQSFLGVDRVAHTAVPLDYKNMDCPWQSLHKRKEIATFSVTLNEESQFL